MNQFLVSTLWLATLLTTEFCSCVPPTQPLAGASTEQLAGVSTEQLLVSDKLNANKIGEAGTPGNTTQKIVICGHLYSLYVRNKIMNRNELIFSEEYLKEFASEIDRIQPEATFFLGDNTRFAKNVEWEMLERIFKNVGGQKIWVAGNHDLINSDGFDGFGGVRNASYVIGRNKFIVLDSKSIYEQDDLEFIEEEVSDWEDYDEVFILMHFILVQYADVTLENDPYKAYTGESNWNRDVVPLIAGRVRYVFAGDYYDNQVGRLVQQHDGHEIHYFRNSFLFRRDRGDDLTGDGPMIYIVLEFDEAGRMSVIPRILPIDIRDPWYRNFTTNARGPAQEDLEEPIEGNSSWRRYIFKNEIAVELPRAWKFKREQGDLLFTGRQFPDGSGIQAQLFSYSDHQDIDLEEFERELLDAAQEELGRPVRIERAGEYELFNGLKVRWSIADSLRGGLPNPGLNCLFMHRGSGYLMTFTTNELHSDYRLTLFAQLLMFKVIERIRIGS